MLLQILTLSTTPAVYLYLDQLGEWFTKNKPRAAEGLNHEPA
jgi:hypothetical protein